MLLSSNQMDARAVMPPAYAEALYLMFKEMRSDGTVLTDDVAGITYTPDAAGFSVNPNKTFDANDPGATAYGYPAANKAVAADEDLLSLVVCRVPTPTSLSNFGVGSGAGGMINRFISGAGSSKGIVSDTATQVQLGTGNTEAPGYTSGDYILSAIGWDRSVGVYQYLYNITQDTVEYDVSVLTVANFAFAPGATLRFTNMKDVLFGGVFSFPAADGGLPSTWRADVLATARALVNEKA